MDKTLQHLQTAGTMKALIQTGAETCIFQIRCLDIQLLNILPIKTQEFLLELEF